MQGSLEGEIINELSLDFVLKAWEPPKDFKLAHTHDQICVGKTCLDLSAVSGKICLGRMCTHTA